MDRVDLLLAMRFGSSLGAGAEELKELEASSLVPLLDLLQQHRNVRIALRLDGYVCDWLLRSMSGCIDRIRELAGRGQVELLAGPHYCASADLIPDADREAQVAASIDAIARIFRVRARGVWFPPGMFDPRMVPMLSRLNADHVLLEMGSIEHASSRKEDLSGYLMLEEQGSVMKVFPLRDESEEVRVTPAAYEVKWNETSVKALFQKVGDPESGIRTLSFSSLVDEADPSGTAAVRPAASGRAVLYEDAVLNNLHKKILSVSSRIEPLGGAALIGEGSEERKKAVAGARHLLLLAEGGLDGGAASVRPAFSRLIEAENLVDGVLRKGAPFLDLSVTDHDRDGHNEAVISTKLFNLYVSPRRGGTIFEADYRQKKANIIGVPRGLRSPVMLHDHFMAADEDPNSFLPKLKERRPDGGPAPYKVLINRNPSEVQIKLSREAEVPSEGGALPVKLTKTISVFSGQSMVQFYYEIENRAGRDISFKFGSEFDFSLEADLNEKKVLKESRVKLVDAKRGFSVTLAIENISEIWGFKLAGQSGPTGESVMVPSWDIKVPATAVWTRKISLIFEE